MLIQWMLNFYYVHQVCSYAMLAHKYYSTNMYIMYICMYVHCCNYYVRTYVVSVLFAFVCIADNDYCNIICIWYRFNATYVALMST